MSNLSIQDLSPGQLELLRRRLARKRRNDGKGAAYQAVVRRQGDGPWPLSFAQQRLWFIHQLESRSAAYHIPMWADLVGRLDFAALVAALSALQDRHEALRTTFAVVEGRPVQVVAKEVSLAFGHIDLSRLAEDERRIALARVTEQEGCIPFDLEQGPMLRATVVQLERERFRLLLTLHHVAADNWSVGILIHELSEFYAAQVLDREAILRPLTVQYADYAIWQRQRLQAEILDKELSFWRTQLATAPPVLELPTDRLRPVLPSFRFGRLSFSINLGLHRRIIAFARQRKTTQFNVLLAVFNTLLHRYAEVEDIVVGSPVAGRQRSELEGLIGFFVNTLLLRNQPKAELPFEEFLRRVHEGTLEAHAHQDLPFDTLVEDLRPERDSTFQPLFQVMFNLYDGSLPELRFRGLEVEHTEVEIGTWNDLDLLLVEVGGRLDGFLRYNADLFEVATAEAFAESYLSLLHAVLERPETSLGELALSPFLLARAEASRQRHPKVVITLCATFTAEALGAVFELWGGELGLSIRPFFAPYNQVFQQLLDPESLLRRRRDGVNVLLLRCTDWLPYVKEDEPSLAERRLRPAALAEVEKSILDLLSALDEATARSSAPWVVVHCPEAPEALAVDSFRVLAEGFEKGLSALAEGRSNLQVSTPNQLHELYPVAELHDPWSDNIGHVPYTPRGFTALGTMIVRQVYGLINPPIKVVVLDCDQTLWRGVCAEDGPQGVVLDPARAELQRFLRAQQEAGVLLCLCSKNNEEDVWRTFDQREDFPLRREHLTAARLNWLAKSENVKGLAEELDLGLDSFLFVDDNPVECAEVRAGCPEVLVLELPVTDEAAIPQILRHYWAFDRRRVTAEDSKRTLLYRQRMERQRQRQGASSFVEFLASLDLKVELSEMSERQLPRVAQLTQRTNQFNTTTLRRGEGEIRRLIAEEGFSCRVAEVRDRFGDYGLVGVVLYRRLESSLEVDSFLLSCRVLGRGVEHRILASLGAEALERGLRRVDLLASPTARNQPVYDFLRSVVGDVVGDVVEEVGEEKARPGGGSCFALAAASAATTCFAPGATEADARPTEAVQIASAGTPTAAPKDTDPQAALSPEWGRRSERLGRIAVELADVAEIHRRLEELRRLQGFSVAAGRPPYEAPRGVTEEGVAALFVEVLAVEDVGRQDNFFHLGGHSLIGTVFLSRIRDAFGVELPVVHLFQSPTVARMAESLDAAAPAAEQEPITRISARRTAPVEVEELSDEEVRSMLGALVGVER